MHAVSLATPKEAPYSPNIHGVGLPWSLLVVLHVKIRRWLIHGHDSHEWRGARGSPGARLPAELPSAPPQEGLVRALFRPRIAMFPSRRMRDKITPTMSLIHRPSNNRAIAGEGCAGRPVFETCRAWTHHQAPPRNARTKCSTDPPSML